MQYQPQLSRRSVLRGLGAAVTLPFLPSLAWAHGQDSELPPRRFLSIVNGDGYHPSEWWAKQAAGGLELGPTLQSLAPFRDSMALVTGLNHQRRMARVHGYGFTTMLSCEYAPSGKIQAGISVDQILAREFGRHTPIPSLVLGTEPVRPGMVNGAPAIYQATCSWSSPSTPIPPEVIPQQAFQRLFDVSSLLGDQSVLDHVLKRQKRLTGNLSVTDQHKLDEFFTSVREIEKRIERAVSDEPRQGWQPSLAEPDMPEPAPGLPDERTEHLRLMMDIITLALRMDKTRVVNFILHQDFSGMQYDFLEGVSKGGHHGKSHHQDKPENIAEYVRVNHYLVEQVAYLCQQMRAIDEGHGTTLLDNTLILYGSCMFDGNKHIRENLPLVLLGGRSHGLQANRIHDFTGSELNELGNLHLTLARQQGLDVSSVGEGTRTLPGIFA